MVKKIKYAISKSCKISKEQNDYLNNNPVSFSKLVRGAINKLIKGA